VCTQAHGCLLNSVMQFPCFQYISCECTYTQCQGELRDINIIMCWWQYWTAAYICWVCSPNSQASFS